MQRIFILLGPLLAVAGCSVSRVPPVQAPSAEVVAVRMTEQTVEAVAVAVTVRLVNPNAFALPVSSQTYRIEIDGRSYSFRGVAGASMPPAGSQLLTLTGAVATDGRDMTGADWRVEGHVVYVKPGEVRRILVESGLPEPRLAFSGQGSLR